MANDATNGLREALSVTPSNVPLRLLLAAALMEHQQQEEAELEFKKALQLEPDNVRAKMGLADACQAQGKLSMALVVLEDLMRSPEAPPESFLAQSQKGSLTDPAADALGKFAFQQQLVPRKFHPIHAPANLQLLEHGLGVHADAHRRQLKRDLKQRVPDEDIAI